MGAVTAGDVPVSERLPAARVPSAARLDPALVVDVLARLAGADSTADIAAASLPPLLDLPGVRAACLVVRDGDDAVVVGSAGYDCGTMAPGARLPLDAGLPVTEAVRTGRRVVQGGGPSWIAVPYGRARRGALLLSLTVAPPADEESLRRLERVGRAVGDALHRAAEQERTFAELALVTSGLASPVVARRAGRWPCAPSRTTGRWAVTSSSSPTTAGAAPGWSSPTSAARACPPRSSAGRSPRR